MIKTATLCFQKPKGYEAGLESSGWGGLAPRSHVGGSRVNPNNFVVFAISV
jgi:hypothetical protein